MSIMVEFEAEIKSIGETEVFNSGFQKRSMIVKLLGEKENPEYPTWLTVEAKKDNVVQFDAYKPNQIVSLKCFLSGNLWTPTDGRPERAFVGLDLWKIEPADGVSSGGKGAGYTEAPQFDEDGPATADIPF